MFVIKVEVLAFVFCHLVIKSQGLDKLTITEENIIMETEATLKNISNKLFGVLHLVKLNSKSKQSLLVHKYFTSITVKDQQTLNLIFILSRADKNNMNNVTDHFMTIINDILDADYDLDVDFISHDEDVIDYIDEFLNNIEGFKERTYHNDYQSLEIKDEIIHILRSDNSFKYNASEPEMVTKLDEEMNTISDNEFWTPQPERRIYQGDRTKIKYFPFMASIHIFDGFQCAGSIIKSDLIITAASCLQLAWNNRFFRENPAFLSVRVGSNFYNGGGENIPVLEVYFYPSYNPKTLKNNIAIMRLVRHLKFRRTKRRLKKIEIDREDSSLPMTTDGITIVGWGARGTSNIVRDPWSNQLAFAVLDVYHLQECQDIYSKEYVTRTNFCAGFISKGGGACNHDVGGPGVVNGILTGVISFGSPVCGARDAPTVFTKVGFYADWIEEIMEQDVPHTRKKTTPRFQTVLTTPLPYLEETTFKIDALGPELYKETESLRILEEEELFKEFLSTMFNSKEVKEYNDLLNEITLEKPKRLTRIDDKPEKNAKQDAERTKAKSLELADLESQESGKAVSYTKIDSVISKKTPIRYTRYDINMFDDTEEIEDANEAAEKNITDFIVSTEISKPDTISSSSENEGLELETTTKKKPNKLGKIHKGNNENVKMVELFYLSDNETINTSAETYEISIEDLDDNYNEGLAIIDDEPDGAPSNKTMGNILDFLSKNDLYDLLSDVIDEVTKNKTNQL